MTDAERPVVGSTPGQGLDPGLQAQLAELNAQLLEWLRQGAESPSMAVAPAAFAVLLPQLRRVGEPGLQALARCPYLLLDAGFARPDCWDGAVREAADARSGGWLAQAADPHLVRATVMLGWHLARANPYAARLSLGMTPQCARLIARLRLRELESLVERRAASCRLRWEDQPAIWQQLLEAAMAGATARLEILKLRGVQLIAAEHRPRADTGRLSRGT